MKKLLLLSTVLFGTSMIFSQPTLDWANSSGGSSLDMAYASTVDGSGNVFTTGIFLGSGDFNPGAGTQTLTSAGNFDIYIQRLDANGNYVWAEKIGSTGADRSYDILLAQSGDLYVTGYFQGTVDFNPGGGTANLTASGLEDGFLLKLDANGNYVWAVQFGGAGDDIGFSLAEDASNNIILGGYVGNDFVVKKFTSAGATVWTKQITPNLTSNNIAVKLAVNSNNDIYLTGGFQGTMDSDPGIGIANLTSQGNFDFFYIKFDQNGNYLSSESTGSTGIDLARDVTIDNSGNPIFIGSYSGTVDFDLGPGTSNSTAIGSTDIFILKLNSSDNYSWHAAAGGTITDSPIDIAIDSNNDLYISGEFGETVDFDPGIGIDTYQAAGTGGGVDVFVWKLLENGSYGWTIAFGETDVDDSGLCVDIGPSDVIYVAGIFSGTVDFDPGPGTTNITSLGSTDAFNMKLAPCVPASLSPDVATLSDLTDECSVAVPTSLPTATSNCGDVYTGTPDATFPITTQGTTVVTWTYDDGNGNTATQTQNVIINDVTDPVPDVTTLSEITADCEVTSLNTPTATDNCSGSINGTHNASLPLTTSTTVTWTYDDGNGNTVTQDQLVTITPIDNGISVVDEITLTADASGLNYQWIDCSDNSQISGATNQTYIASSNGSYAVIVDNGTCSDTSDCLVISTVSFEDAKNKWFSVYPNPSAGKLVIKMSHSEIDSKIEITDVSGKIILSGNVPSKEFELNLSEQESGIYFIKLYSSKEIIIQQIILNK